jgi:hypothetical protein
MHFGIRQALARTLSTQPAESGGGRRERAMEPQSHRVEWGAHQPQAPRTIHVQERALRPPRRTGDYLPRRSLRYVVGHAVNAIRNGMQRNRSAMTALHHNASQLAGQRFGRLLVIEPDGKTDDLHIAWRCKCDCGKEKRIASNSLTRSSPVQSCGCMNRDTAQRKRRVGGVWNDGKSYAVQNGARCYRTRHAWATAVIRHYGNKCERCGWDKARCDAHHRVPKAQGGFHTIANGVVLCPNCHRLEHEAGRADCCAT